jgi:hypothetical protein
MDAPQKLPSQPRSSDNERDLFVVEDEIHSCVNQLRKLKQSKNEGWVNECINSSNSHLPPNNSKN